MDSDLQMKKKIRLKIRFTNRKEKEATTNQQQQQEDRLSNLPDELIHQILKYVDTKLAVQTSLLSKRWKLVWTTLPFLNLFVCSDAYMKCIDKLLAHRNHNSEVLKLNLTFRIDPCLNLVYKVISYAISHRVQELNVDLSWYLYDDIILSIFKSSTIKKLTLGVFYDEESLVSECWNLPVVTTLHLVRPFFENFVKLPESYLTCLPCLQTLLLDGFQLPKSICLPTLTTLILYEVEFTHNVTEFFHALVNLRNLTLLFRVGVYADFVVNCPQLVNLKIENYTCTMDMISDSGMNHKVMVLAPNIRTFSSVNFCPVTFGVAKLEKVNISLKEFEDSTRIETVADPTEAKKFCRLITDIFLGMCGAKILSLDMNTIEALSALSNLLVYSPPPFYNLKYVKVPHGYSESSMSTSLKKYLLGCSPKAAIVTTLPQKTMIHHTEAVTLTAQTVVLQNPLVAPTKVLVGSENMHKTVCVNTLDVGVQEENLVQNSVVNADRITQIGVPVQGTSNVHDQVSSSRDHSDVGLWQGHVVNSEFVSLLDRIMNKYPETFELFTTTNKKLSTMKLNMLGNSLSIFTKLSMTHVDTEMIAEQRVVFDALHKLGFNISWLVNRLNYIEELRFSQPLLSELHAIDCNIDNAKDKLQNLQARCNDDTKTILQGLHTLRAEKMQQIQKAFGTVGTNLVVGYIGDDLLSGP